MFACSCSEDSLKIGSSPASPSDGFRRGLTDQGSMVQLRSSSLRGMALEERKFVNTVVATGGGGDLLMLGTSAGRQKRERKMPSRYHDTDAFDASGVIDISKCDDQELIDGDSDVGERIAVPAIEERQAKRLKVEHLKEETIKKCTVLLPRIDLPETVQPWCMYHCQHSCPCSKFRNPLDFGPDLTASRNVAKRTLGGNFKTAKRESVDASSEKPQVAKRTLGKPGQAPLVRSNSTPAGSTPSAAITPGITAASKPSPPTSSNELPQVKQDTPSLPLPKPVQIKNEAVPQRPRSRLSSEPSSIVQLEDPSTKLKCGKNLVTMTRDGQAVMQIKLPTTTPQQYWSTIKVVIIRL